MSQKPPAHTKQVHTNINTTKFAQMQFSTNKAMAAYSQKLIFDLQKTIEIKKLLVIFANNIKNLIEFSGFNYKYKNLNIDITFGKPAEYLEVFRLKQNNFVLGIIEISSKTKIPKTQLNLLKFSLTKLIYPLKNCLKFQKILQCTLEDPLTMVGNKRALLSELAREVNYSQRYKNLLCLLMIDMDNFKCVNDQLGHARGDEVMRLAAKTIKECMRLSDAAFRYGGDEFTLLLPNTNIFGAAMLVDRLKEKLCLAFGEVNRQLPPNRQLSVSIGIGALLPTDNYQALLQRADKALYTVKQQNKQHLLHQNNVMVCVQNEAKIVAPGKQR